MIWRSVTVACVAARTCTSTFECVETDSLKSRSRTWLPWIRKRKGGVMGSRLFRGNVAVALLVLCTLAIPATHWYLKHMREVREDEVNKAKHVAYLSDAETALGRLKASWSANDNWENDVSSKGTTLSPYSADLKRVLIKAYPLIFFGAVEDIRAADEHGVSLVSIRVRGRKGIRMRLLLTSASGTTEYLLTNKSAKEVSLSPTYPRCPSSPQLLIVFERLQLLTERVLM